MTNNNQEYQEFLQKLFRTGKEMRDEFDKLSQANKIRFEHEFPQILASILAQPKS